MSRPRSTIAGLMAIVLFMAVGFAALRNANDFWASATFTFAIITVSVALVGAFARKGEVRTSWAGFAAVGFACLVLWLSTPETVGGLSRPPRLLASWGFRHLRPYINPAADAGGQNHIYYEHVSNSVEAVIFGLMGAILGRFVAVKDDRPNP